MKLDGDSKQCAITKSVRTLSPEGHLINEAEITIVGYTLDECYEKYLLVKKND